MAQMAATAGGVAIGSTIGHVVGDALTSGGSNEAPAAAPPAAAAAPAAAAGYAPAPAYAAEAPLYAPPAMAPRGGGLEGGPCGAALADFIDCAQTQSDLSFCQGVNDVLKQCRMDYGV